MADDLAEKIKTLKIDEDFYGLQGLDTTEPLYRVCRYSEDTNKDIVCKAKTKEEEERTVNQHVTSGSKKPSRFISTTAALDVALEWAYYAKDEPCNGEKEKEKEKQKRKQKREFPQPIIKIDLTKIKGMEEEDNLINLTNKRVREHFVSGPLQPAWVKSSQEVLFQWCIPKTNFEEEIVFELLEIEQDEEPSPPKCKGCKRCKK